MVGEHYNHFDNEGELQTLCHLLTQYTIIIYILSCYILSYIVCCEQTGIMG